MQHFECLWDTLQEFIDTQNYDVKQIEEATGISNSRIYDYLNRKHLPDLNSALKLSKYFKCSLDFMFGFTQENNYKEFTVNASVNERVKYVIDNCGKSRYAISKSTKISQAQLCNWYKGKKTPTLASLVVIADKLECSLDFLAGK